MKARQMVATSAIVSFVVLAMAEEQRTGSLPPTKRLIAYGFVFFVLSAFADFNVDAAGAFALLAMVAIILAQGDDALKFVGARINK
jgi:hypothetical protein